MKHAFVIATIFTLLSCNNEDVTTTTGLNGKWVDVKTRTDTLTFGLSGQQDIMILGRGKEMRGGFLLPKSGTGPYNYKLLAGDTISLYWLLSSNSRFNNYYFSQTGNTLMMEKFFETSASGTMLTFEKVD